MVLVSLFVFVNGGYRSQKEQMKWIVWEGVGEYSCFMLCGQGRNDARSSVARPEGELGEQC